MKYWRGYLTAAIFAALAWVLAQFGKNYNQLVDLIYPYVTRFAQGMLADWTSSVDFLVWQALVVAAVVIALATVVLMIIFRWNFIQWVGWVLAVVSLVFCLHTGFYGVNYYAGALADDIRLEVVEPSKRELELTTIYFRNEANRLADKLPRDEQGGVIYPDFEKLAQQAGDGFQTLTHDHLYSVFAGSTLPVKKLGWADLYTSMGISGMTIALTGEAAVNPQTPVMALPWTMCHEMAHRMSIAREDDANFAAFLASQANESYFFQYSAYFMAYRYCISAMAGVDSTVASRIRVDVNTNLAHDLAAYDNHYNSNRNEAASQLADTANDTYLKVSGDEQGAASYGAVTYHLVSWYLQTFHVEAEPEETVPKFDPFDETQVDLSGLRGYETTPSEAG